MNHDPNFAQGIIEGAKQDKREVYLGLHKNPQEALEDTRIGLEVQRDEYTFSQAVKQL